MNLPTLTEQDVARIQRPSGEILSVAANRDFKMRNCYDPQFWIETTSKNNQVAFAGSSFQWSDPFLKYPSGSDKIQL